MPRLFIAIDLPEASKDKLLSLRQRDLPPGRWARREALHLTLRFIGDAPRARARAYQAALRAVEADAFEMRIAGVGQFPPDARPRVIWAGVENSAPLRALRDAVERALEREGLPSERRRFHPHITLMRFKEPIRRGLASRWINAHLDFQVEPVAVQRFALYESRLKPSGAVYAHREVYELRQSAAASPRR